VVLAFFRPLRSGGNPDNDFRAAWTKVVRSMQPPEPIYEHKSLVATRVATAARTLPTAATTCTYMRWRPARMCSECCLVTPNRQSFNTLEPLILLFVDGVRQLPLKSQTPKTSITIADLVGEWRSSGDSSLSYVTSSGAYAGSSTMLH